MAELTKVALLDKLGSARLWKVKSRMVREALLKGASERGNHVVTANEESFKFYYRGTLLSKVTYETVEDHPIIQITHYNAGDFEHTASTQNQRKTIEDCVTEIRKVVGQ